MDPTKERICELAEKARLANECGDAAERARIGREGLTLLAQLAREEKDEFGLALIAALDAATRAGYRYAASHLSVLCMIRPSEKFDQIVGQIYGEVDLLVGAQMVRAAEVCRRDRLLDTLKREAEKF